MLHLVSLPSEHGIGDLGAAENFIEFLSRTGQTIWQVLPVGPTGYADSPYQCFSAFAGNPLLINLFDLFQQGLLDQSDLNSGQQWPKGSVDYERVIAFKKPLLRKAAQRFLKNRNNQSVLFKAFCESNATWLDDYALFMAAKDFYGGSVWTEWDTGLRTRDRDSIEKWQQSYYRKWKPTSSSSLNFSGQWASGEKTGAAGAISELWETSQSMWHMIARMSGLIPKCFS